jgi:dienelactone hydrolase
MAVTHRNRIPLALAAALTLTLGLAAPTRAQTPERISTPGLGQAPDSGLYIDPKFTAVKTAEDVVYGRSVDVDGVARDRLVDVWEPIGHDEQFRPVMVWAHGGGCTHGDKNWLNFSRYLVQRGYVVAAITYRMRSLPSGGFFGSLGNPDGVPQRVECYHDAIEDAKAAVRWVRANAAEYRMDPGRVSIGGWSAGAFVSLGVAFDSDNPGDSGNPGWPSHVSAALPGAGAYVPGVFGDVVQPGDPPIAFFHAAQETTIPMPSVLPVCANTVAMGNVCEGNIWPEETDHDLADHQVEIGALAAGFLHRNVLQGERTSTAFEDVTTAVHGETAVVTGRLVTEQGDPVADARVLARATAGWAESETADDGSFIIEVNVPDHGKAADILLRYEGFYPNRPSLPTTRTPLAPTHFTASATWGAAPR